MSRHILESAQSSPENNSNLRASIAQMQAELQAMKKSKSKLESLQLDELEQGSLFWVTLRQIPMQKDFRFDRVRM